MRIYHRLTLAALPFLLCLAQTGAAQTPPRKVVEVTAKRFTFDPAEITVDEGTQLEIRLRSNDTTHGFRIKGTTTTVTVPEGGEVVSVKFDATTPGRYEFACSKMCGAGHRGMKGAIVVKPRGSSSQQK